MELFIVNRYKEEESLDSKNNENKILENIRHKIEKKQRKRKLIAVQADEDNLDTTLVNNGETSQIEDVSTTSARSPAPAENDENLVDENIVNDYEVLGEDTATAKRIKIDVILPNWLAYPTKISTKISLDGVDEQSAIANLNYLAPHIREALQELNITHLFPVQSCVIPWVLNANDKPYPFRPRDICVSSPTGSGKTLAFAIPIVQLLNNRVRCKIRALVLLPVAELAVQIYKVFKKLCDKTELKVCLLSKQVPFAVEQEKLVEFYDGEYYSKVDIVITTPGRLVDHIHSTKGFCLKSLKFLVIDEADRVMDAIFQNWFYHLDEHVRTTSEMLFTGRPIPLCYNALLKTAHVEPHKMLFSATLSQDPEKLQKVRLFHPKLFTSTKVKLNKLSEKLSDNKKEEASDEFIGKYTTPAELKEKYCITEDRLKPLTLFALIQENGWNKFLCFTNSNEASSRLAYVLKGMFQGNLNIDDLASHTGPWRSKLLSRFSRGQVSGLICSDALARGIDIPDVDIVISYDIPRHIKTYIHRIGRTARAGRAGTAVTLLTQNELQLFQQTLSEFGKTINEEITVSSTIEEDHAQLYSKAIKSLHKKVEKDKRAQILIQKRIKETAVITKDVSNMTLMERLQVQATEHMHIKNKNMEENINIRVGKNVKEKKTKRNKTNKFNKVTLKQK